MDTCTSHVMGTSNDFMVFEVTLTFGGQELFLLIVKCLKGQQTVLFVYCLVPSKLCVCVCVSEMDVFVYLHVGEGGLWCQSDSLPLILLRCPLSSSLAARCPLVRHGTV